MTYPTALLLVFGGFGLLFAGLYLLFVLREKALQRKIENMPFPDAYIAILSKTPHYPKLSLQERQRLQRSILRFIHTKTFSGVGLTVTDEMKVIIAFYACLLLLHLTTESCYEALKTIIVYPHAVVVKEVKSAGGIFTKEQFVIAGQSSNETVVITWHEAKREAYHLRHNNVIIHEFAHEIDFMDGYIDGVPPLENSKYDAWASLLSKEFAALNRVALKDRDWGKYKLLGRYAASNEGEFFAVVTERFFEAPASLQHHFPELYKELEAFYRIDMAGLLA